MSWDAIVVGARCAGAPLARFIARGGKRVLVLDSAHMPSDQPLSTHFIQPYGMRVLDELELGDRVRAIAPPVMTFVQAVGPHMMRLDLPYGGCCPRRIDLDPLLIEGAREAGADVRLQHRVVDLLREGTRVVGVVAEQPDGTRAELRAGVVVGADGRSSTIASLAGAEEYFGYDNPKSAYWAYYPRPSWYGTDPVTAGASFLCFYDRSLRVSFPTNKDQLLVGVVFPNEDVPRWKSDPRSVLEAELRADPLFARLIEGSAPIGKVVGILKARYFFRQAAGPGWALVGDAGLHKDPTPGLGISDALRDARSLGKAILEGGDPALERYWRQRDVDSWELYNFARDMGELDYNNPLNQLVFSKLKNSDALKARILDVIDRKLSPFDAFKPTEVMGWTFGALFRGKFGVLRPFFRAGMRTSAVKKELVRRRKLATLALPAAVLAVIAVAAAPAAADPRCMEHPTTIIGHVEQSIDHHAPKPAEFGFWASRSDPNDPTSRRLLEVHIPTDKRGRFVMHLGRGELDRLANKVDLMQSVARKPTCEGRVWIEAWDYAWPHGGEKRYQSVIIDALK